MIRITIDTQARLLALHERFNALEREARLLEVAPEDVLLLVRADGIKASKHFLKDTLQQPDYDKALEEAVFQTYYLWRNWTHGPNRPYLLGALRLSDEVSFVINRGDNYYHRRPYKITTSLASTLSGSMSLTFARLARHKKQDPPIMAFDGRPLLISDERELSAYIHWRRLLYARNAMARVLRLQSKLSDTQLYQEQPRLADDIFRLSQEIDARNLWAQFHQAAAGSSLYVAAPNGRLENHPLPADPTNDSIVVEHFGSHG